VPVVLENDGGCGESEQEAFDSLEIGATDMIFKLKYEVKTLVL
jgi:hypothetical protein